MLLLHHGHLRSWRWALPGLGHRRCLLSLLGPPLVPLPLLLVRLLSLFLDPRRQRSKQDLSELENLNLEGLICIPSFCTGVSCSSSLSSAG